MSMLTAAGQGMWHTHLQSLTLMLVLLVLLAQAVPQVLKLLGLVKLPPASASARSMALQIIHLLA